MKKIALYIAILALSLSACAQKTEPNVPAKLDTPLPWLQVKIGEYQNQPVSNPPRSILKTTFEGKAVYYVPPVCCDIPSELYAEDGKLMCYPSGGITGAGDGRCPMFRIEYWDNKNNHPQDNKTSIVWQDKRKPVATKRDVPHLQ